MSEAVGKQLLASLIDSKDGLQQFVGMGLEKQWFRTGEEEIYDYMVDHVTQYGTFPTRDTILKHTSELLPPITSEPPAYYLDQTKQRYVHTTIRKGLVDVEPLLVMKKPYEALEILNAMVLDLVLQKHGNKIVDFAADAHDMLKKDWEKKNILEWEGVEMGWPYMDKMTGGLETDDVVGIIGRPAAGKTYNVLHMAQHAWYHQKKKPLVISMEMKPLPIMHRLSAMYTHLPITKIKHMEISTKWKEKLWPELYNLKEFGTPFWIVDGGMASTVRDIALLASQLQPDCVYIDGAYLLRHPDKRLRRWERIAENVEAIKEDIGTALGIPTVASFQFNRDAVKKKKAIEDVGLEDIAGADAIGQICSIVLGLFQEDSVETLRQKRIDVLKGRYGETGRFNINWIFDLWPYMDFSEKPKETAKQLQFV